MYYWSCELNAILYLSTDLKLKSSEISEQFLIPYSSVCRIIDKCLLQRQDWTSQYIKTRCKAHYDDVMLRYIRTYCLNAKDSYTSKDIQHGIQFDFNICISLPQIRKFIKDDLQLSFKKGVSRPVAVNSPRSQLIKRMFAIEFGGLWKENYLYINID